MTSQIFDEETGLLSQEFLNDYVLQLETEASLEAYTDLILINL